MQGIKFLVIDEADRLLSEGHFKEVEDILSSLDRVEDTDMPDEADSSDDEEAKPGSERQTLVFSATFHRDLQQKLAGKSKWTGGDIMNKKESMEYLLQKLNFREEKPKFIDVNPIQQMAEGLKEGIVECAAMEKVCHISVAAQPASLANQASRISTYTHYLCTTPNIAHSSLQTPFPLSAA
jgi:ATP-dependent RNA helicase DDX24/MAK5